MFPDKKNVHLVMSEYHKMDTNKYPNIFGCHIIHGTNIQKYLDAILCTEQISKYIRMALIYVTNIRIYFCTPEIAQIQIRIIFGFFFIQIFEYSYSSLIDEIF